MVPFGPAMRKSDSKIGKNQEIQISFSKWCYKWRVMVEFKWSSKSPFRLSDSNTWPKIRVGRVTGTKHFFTNGLFKIFFLSIWQIITKLLGDSFYPPMIHVCRFDGRWGKSILKTRKKFSYTFINFTCTFNFFMHCWYHFNLLSIIIITQNL